MSDEKPQDCSDKLAFETAEAATAARAEAKWRHGSKNLGVYKCRLCNLYHLKTDYPDID